jgi:hypothetical protein
MHAAMRRSGDFPAELPKNWRALVGMAGLVAEEILHGMNDELLTQK